VVPQPVADYSTRSILTMDQIEGRKITSLGPLARMEMDGAPLAEELCADWVVPDLSEAPREVLDW
jgi:predicted unusual protein kinase regulating ubiquinone biosynthesis (AarF/ABC1/UbiB family)